MLTPEEIQAAIIALMKSKSQLVSAVQLEIREDNWMGTEFKYPAYRVAVNAMSPYSDGECRLTMLDVPFVVYCYAESSSSKASAYLAGLVSSALMGLRITGPRIIPISRIDVPRGGVIPPVPEGERLWRSEVNFEAKIKEIGV